MFCCGGGMYFGCSGGKGICGLGYEYPLLGCSGTTFGCGGLGGGGNGTFGLGQLYPLGCAGGGKGTDGGGQEYPSVKGTFGCG